MNKQEFNKLLKSAELTKKEFSNIVNLSPVTVNGWGGNDKSIPSWVKPFLELYIDNKKIQHFKQMIKDSGICD